jgi:hypothetical protein
MFLVNTYRWDYPTVAALAAPRPLLIANTDKDSIFPYDGVSRLYGKVRGVYSLGKQDEPYHPLKADLGLQISEGGHADTPELQVAAFRWFNRFLKGEDKPIDLSSAKKAIDPEQLRVFKDGLPADAINARVHETFVPTAPAPKVPDTKEEWAKQREAWMAALREKCFAGWPEGDGGPLDAKEVSQGVYEFASQPHVRLRVKLPTLSSGDRIVLDVGESGAFCPRGVGDAAWSGDEKKQVQLKRRFMLLGQTVEGMQVWDVRRAVQAVRSLPGAKDVPICLRAKGPIAGVALYAALFEPGVDELELTDLPKSHVLGPHFLNVLRVLDTPQALAMVAEKTKVRLVKSDVKDWDYANETAKAMKWSQGQIEFQAGQ